MSQPMPRNDLPRIFWAVWEKLWWLFGIVLLGGGFLLGVNNPVLFVMLLSLVFIFSGIGTLVYVKRMRRRQRQSIAWVPVQGRILASAVEKKTHRYSSATGGGTTVQYYPRVAYAYQYQGTPYQAKGIITFNINWPRKEAEAAVARYPEGAAVTVWVNPEVHHQAVLETGMGPYSRKFKLGLLIGAAFLIAGTIGWFLAPLVQK
jgi:hypothetical protein